MLALSPDQIFPSTRRHEARQVVKMGRNNLSGLSPLWLISLAMVLGTVIVVMIPAAISGGDKIKASDWIGFAGNVLAGVVTIVAAIIAWVAVQQQIREQRKIIIDQIERESEARRAREVEAKEVAIIVLRNPVFALAAVAKAIHDWYGIVEQPQSTNEYVNARALMKKTTVRLRTATNHFAVAQAWQNLCGEDRANYLALSSTLSMLLFVFENPPDASSDKARLKFYRRQVMRFANRLRRFDDGLAKRFEENSTKPKRLFRDSVRPANRA
jgi:hypothetical protein